MLSDDLSNRFDQPGTILGKHGEDKRRFRHSQTSHSVTNHDDTKDSTRELKI
jgi:hypothetical protein